MVADGPVTSAGAARWAPAMYGAGWLAVAGLVAVVVRLRVPTPAELLADVAVRPATWIGANVVLIVLQLLLVDVVSGVQALVGRRTRPARFVAGAAWLAGGALVASGVFHGVFGAHLASKVVVSDSVAAPPERDLVRLAELTHALGDTCWFIGVGGLMVTTALAVPPGWAGGARQRTVAAVGAASIVANLLQFGWFADHRFGVFAAPGTLLQAAWFGGLTWVARPAGAVVGSSGDRLSRPPHR